MDIDLWALGLQAINVLILVWLLSRVFWRPVAAAIARRQDSTTAMLQAAQATQARADAALAEATQARDGIEAERRGTLEAAHVEADSAAKATLAEARETAETILTAARTRIAQETEAARKANESAASDLSLRIAARLMERLDSPVVQRAFLAQLLDAIKAMPAEDRAALVAEGGGIDIVTARDPGPERDQIEAAIRDALGGRPALRFVTDPDLIAGMDLRSGHFVLHNSWQADLHAVRKAVQDAA